MAQYIEEPIPTEEDPEKLFLSFYLLRFAFVSQGYRDPSFLAGTMNESPDL